MAEMVGVLVVFGVVLLVLMAWLTHLHIQIGELQHQRRLDEMGYGSRSNVTQLKAVGE